MARRGKRNHKPGAPPLPEPFRELRRQQSTNKIPKKSTITDWISSVVAPSPPDLASVTKLQPLPMESARSTRQVPRYKLRETAQRRLKAESTTLNPQNQNPKKQTQHQSTTHETAILPRGGRGAKRKAPVSPSARSSSRPAAVNSLVVADKETTGYFHSLDEFESNNTMKLRSDSRHTMQSTARVKRSRLKQCVPKISFQGPKSFPPYIIKLRKLLLQVAEIQVAVIPALLREDLEKEYADELCDNLPDAIWDLDADITPRKAFAFLSHVLELFETARHMHQRSYDEVDWYPVIRKALSGVPAMEPGDDRFR